MTPLTQMTPMDVASGLTLEALEAEICCLAGHLNAASHRWLTLIAELDRRQGWAESGARS